MNAPEQIVETYFRIVRRCFTRPDVKIPGGNNRQIDLLAYCLAPTACYHLETTVTHQLGWQWSTDEVVKIVDYKFFGEPRPRDSTNQRTDAARGKKYLKQINDTYASLGIHPDEITRVVCCWTFEPGAQRTVWEQSRARTFPPERLELLSFRDVVIPALRKVVGSSNYDDLVLRTFSLLGQYEAQQPEDSAAY